MIIEQTPNFIAFAGPTCSCCTTPATRLLNIPGNILVPVCEDPECPCRGIEGAVECTAPSADVAAALAEVAKLRGEPS